MSPKFKNPTGTAAALDFYRPHNRETTWTTNDCIDPVTGEIISPPSMTKQSFAAECDINNILRQYSTTGMIEHVRSQADQGKYQDLPDEIDFQTSLHLVMQAEEAFDSLPSKLRSRFNNDPAEFLAFASNPANKDELVELGLATAPPPPPPAPEPPPAPPGDNSGVQG